MLRKLAALVLTSAVVLGGVAVTQAGAAGDSNAASFVAQANAERRERGLRAYVVKADLAAVAARHSERMAERNTLYHNPNLGSEVRGWQVVGENVGQGGSVDTIHAAFMDSPAHRANILATDYTEIGVGTVTDDNGVLWVTQVFRLPANAPKVAQPVAAEAARTVVRVPVRRPAAAPAAPRVKAAAAPAKPRTAPAPVADRPEAAAFLGALAGTAGPADPFGTALAYADTLAALTR